MTAPLALLGIADLAARWSYTRQGVHQLTARPGFPIPVAAVNGGRIRVWLLADIEAFEQGRSELGDQVARQSNVSSGATTKLKRRLGRSLDPLFDCSTTQPG
jgi:hypothetical protein